MNFNFVYLHLNINLEIYSFYSDNEVLICIK